MTKLIVPEAVLEQHTIALGKTGSGKSSKLRVLVEHVLDRELPATIIDPKGDWWGLKASADGRKAGYPIVIFGGEHADVPLNPRAGAELGELIATGNRPSLIDMRGWMPGDRTKFFIEFAGSLFKHIRGKRWLFIDEVHNFAPKGKVFDPDAGKMLHWANRLASEGRGLGLNIGAASQRPQKVHNDFLTSCETLIACRVIYKADRDAIKDWVDGCADPALGKQLLADLANMKRTDAWVWSPEIEFGPKRIEFPMFRTYDSFKPREQLEGGKLKGWAEVDLDEVRAKLSAVVEQAKANDPAELRKRIAELEKQIRAAPAAASAEELDRARELGEDAGFDRAAERAGRSAARFRDQLRDELISNLSNEVRQACDRVPLIDIVTSVDTERRAPSVTIHPQRANRAPATERAIGKMVKAAVTHVRSGNGSSADLPKGEAALLQACIQYPDGLRREQLTVLSGYKKSSRDTYIQRLRERGFVAVAGELVKATDAGREAMPDAAPLPTGEELQEFWRDRLPEGERKIFDELVRVYPKSITREELGERAGYQKSSRDTYLQRMRAKQLIEEPGRGEVRAAEALF